MPRRTLVLTGLMCLVMFSGTAVVAQEAKGTRKESQHPLIPALRIVKAAQKRVRALKGYEADFTKKEIVNRRAISHKMRIKVRHKPFSVYMSFKNPHAGREVIFVEGRNGGNLLAHEAGLLSIAGTVQLKPTGAEAMKENKYPITRFGLDKMLDAVIQQWTLESRYGETDVKYYKSAKLRIPGGKALACKVIESSHPQPRKQFKFHKTRLWIDARTNLPVQLDQYGFPRNPNAKPPLVEQYTYLNLKSDVQLTDRDFDKDNPAYRF